MLVEQGNECPKCGVWGFYSATSVIRGKGLGKPGVLWSMQECGHAFGTPDYARWGNGWVAVNQDLLDAQPCD